MAILTAKVGTNADLFPDILDLYVPVGSTVLDMTWGNGVFWKKARGERQIVRNDINPEKGDYHDDFSNTRWGDNYFDAVIFDPPYLYVGGFKTLKASIDRGYSNKQRALDQGIYGVEGVDKMYMGGMTEGWRILKDKGIFVCKCMDQIMSGRLEMPHIRYIEHWKNLGGIVEDFFVMIVNGQPTMRHKYQLHARRNHSYFIVLRKKVKQNVNNKG